MFDCEIKLDNFRRLIEPDQSDDFLIIVKLSDSKEVPISLSINLARIISKRINDIYMSDPTLSQFTIEFPNYLFNETINENDINEIFQYIIESAHSKTQIPKDKIKLFTVISYLIGEYNKENLSSVALINNQKEAFQTLNSEFHDFSIEYLSSHFLELLKSSQSNSISDKEYREIIDLYNQTENEGIYEIFKQMI